MGPQEAYEELIRFARARGEGALRLAMHAAVPQTFRPELLHLLRLNFLGREFHTPSVEADVLFSPLCEDLGGGYFQFDPRVRTLLLDNLAAAYDGAARIGEVANFLLAYIEQQERAGSGRRGRLWRDYLETQRWTALAYRDPESAAAQLAAALEGATAGGDYAARFQIGGLASSLSAPLVRHRRVLDYAAALQALESGEVERAREYFRELGDEEISVGGVRLRPVSEVFSDWRARHPDAPLPAPAEPTHDPEEEAHGELPMLFRLFVFLIYHADDTKLVNPIVENLMPTGLQYSVHTIEGGPAGRTAFIEEISGMRAALQHGSKEDVDAYVFFQTQSYSHGELAELLLADAVTGPARPVVVVRLDPQAPQLSELGRGVSYVDMTGVEEGFPHLLNALERIQIEKTARQAEGAGATERAPEPPPYEQLLATLREDESEEARAAAAESIGALENPSLLQHLTAALKDTSPLVRAAAAAALGRVRDEYVLLPLLIATRDHDLRVRERAAAALGALGERMVLLLGRFTPGRENTLDPVGEELRRNGYFPVRHLDEPDNLSPTDTTVSLAPYARFLVADLDEPGMITFELDAILRQRPVPILPIIHEQSQPSAVFQDIWKYPGVLPPVTYHSPEDLLANFHERVIIPAEAKLTELRVNPPAPADATPAPAVEQPPAPEYDVYISHSETDVEFTRNFVKAFEYALYSRLGYRPSIFYDPTALHRVSQVEHSREALRRSTTMVSILSPAYLSSREYVKELTDFYLLPKMTSRSDVGGPLRIFGVVTSPVRPHLPRELQHLVLYDFYSHRTAPPVGRASPADLDESAGWTLSNADYDRMMNELAHDVSQMLLDVRGRREEPTPRPAESAKAPPAKKATKAPRAKKAAKAPRAKATKTREQVFICYSRWDRKWLEMLMAALEPFTRDVGLSVWDDASIKPGPAWRAKMWKALASSRVAVLLVSADFLASDFIANHTLPNILKAAKSKGLRVLWVAVGPSLFEQTSLTYHQAANNPANPLSTLSGPRREQELVKIAKLISDAVKSRGRLER